MRVAAIVAFGAGAADVVEAELRARVGGAVLHGQLVLLPSSQRKPRAP
jgi:hypothetical protein